MKNVHRAMRVARRYAEGGSDDEEQPYRTSLMGNPVHNVAGQRDVLQIIPAGSPGGIGTVGIGPQRAEPLPTEPVPPPSANPQGLAQQVAGQLVEKYGDNHRAISEEMLSLNPQDHNDVMTHLPPSIRGGVLDHRLSEANRLIGESQNVPAEEPRQPGASRTGYVSPYGIYGQHAEPRDDIPTSEEEYYGQLSPFEGETYQGIPREKHPFNDMTQGAWDSYQKYIQPKLGSLQDFAKKFFGGYDTRGIRVESAEHPEYGEGSTSFDGTLTDKGNDVAHFSASINPATNSAHLGLLEIEPPYRGEAGPKLLRNQIDMYKQMGLDYVDLHAAGGGDPYGGSYAWAKYGFVPNKQDWDLMRQRFSKRYEDSRWWPADPEAKQGMRNILSNPDPRAVWRLSDVTAPAPGGMPAGKQMLLSHGWSGQLTFNDPGAMRRFDAYIARPKKPKPAQ